MKNGNLLNVVCKRNLEIGKILFEILLIEKEILDADEVESILETGSLPKIGNDSEEDVKAKQESDA